ncbi:MAG TPA: lipopolysaccharide biosynthesis protein, partial [Polyangiales bacterium]
MKPSIRPRQLFADGGIYAATSLAGAALSFLILPVYIAYLGKEGLGTLEVLTAGSTGLTLIVGQGLPTAWFRQRIDHRGPERRIFETTLIWYAIGSSAIALALLSAIGPWLAAHFTPEIPFRPFWLLACVSACAAVVSDMFGVGLQADQRSLQYAAFMLARRVLSLGAIVLFVVVLRRGVLGKLSGETLAALALSLMVFVWLRPQWPTRGSRQMLSAAIAYGLPLLPHGAAMQIIAMADRFVLGHFLGLGAVGVYSLGYRTANVLETINGGMGSAYRALFMKSAPALESASWGEVAARLVRMELLLMAAASFGAQLLSLGMRELLLVAHIDEHVFAESYHVTYIVCFGLFAHAAYALFATPIIYTQGAIGRLPLISAAAASVNLLGCVLFIPRNGLLAAAWATAASHVTIALGAFLVGRKLVPLARPWR